MLAYPIFIPVYTSGSGGDISDLESVISIYCIFSIVLCVAHFTELEINCDNNPQPFTYTCILIACVLFGWLMFPFIVLYRIFCFLKR
jgi:hypothetical protein